MNSPAPDWSPFTPLPAGERPPKIRPIRTPEGIRDRLRTAAFAEIQAREAFIRAAERFRDAPVELRDAWRELAGEEHRHLGWLLDRLAAVGGDPSERPVSTRLWDALSACTTGKEFAVLIAKAEERGRLAGERFRSELAEADPESARIFGDIADEEVAHVELAHRFYPDEAAPPDLG